MFGIAENKSFLSAIGIIDAPEETRALLVAGIEDLIEEKLVIEISNRLTEADAEAFNAISNEDAAYDWLMAHIPDFFDIIRGIIFEIQSDIILRKMAIQDALDAGDPEMTTVMLYVSTDDHKEPDGDAF